MMQEYLERTRELHQAVLWSYGPLLTDEVIQAFVKAGIPLQEQASRVWRAAKGKQGLHYDLERLSAGFAKLQEHHEGFKALVEKQLEDQQKELAAFEERAATKRSRRWWQDRWAIAAAILAAAAAVQFWML